MPLRLRIAADHTNALVPTAPPRPQARFTAVDIVTCSGAFRDQLLNIPTALHLMFGKRRLRMQVLGDGDASAAVPEPCFWPEGGQVRDLCCPRDPTGGPRRDGLAVGRRAPGARPARARGLREPSGHGHPTPEIYLLQFGDTPGRQ
jgi:hypothetical protein